MSFLTKIFGDPNAKVIAEAMPLVEQINAFESSILPLTDQQLRAKTAEFKERLNPLSGGGVTLEDLLPEAFAVVREASRRTTGMRHFDVQLLGGIILHRGAIAEMRTGEGKTLVATLPIYLNALSGQGVHLVTVNDYLAKRDAVWMGQIYDFLGLSIGVIQNLLVSYRYRKSEILAPEPARYEAEKNQKSEINLAEGSAADKERDATGMYKVEYEYLEKCSRREAYQCDIVYGTNNEFGFDYLRDNMVGDLSEMAQRPLHYAIIDEVDSILVDEARTPLIISAPAEEAADMYYKFAELVKRLTENEDYNIDEKMRAATLSEAGIKKMEQWLGVANIYAEGGILLVHHIEQALRAKALFKRDRDYVVEQDEVIIVDEFTGRKMVGRRYSEGLHQAIEAQEGAPIQRESQTMATITFQNYFRLYKKIAGMTGTAVTEAEEFGKIYSLEVVVIPTNKSSRRVDRPDRIYKTQEAKFRAIAAEVKTLQQAGQPVLIGTISVDKNEQLSLFLEREGIKHEILNAKNHEREGEIIAQAGRPGAVTLATNMAGRGVDIILGGNPPALEEADKARAAGGLFVLGTERHESRRIDNQLRGRAGRQGDPGATQFYLSTEDDLMRIFAGDRIRSMMNTLRVPDDMPIEQKSLSRIIESAQKKVEGFHFDTRKHLLEYDDVINRHRGAIYGRRRAVLEAFARPRAARPSEAGELPPSKTLREFIFEMIDNEIGQVVTFHTSAEDRRDWDMSEIVETVKTIFPLTAGEVAELGGFKESAAGKLEAITERTRLIEHLSALARQKYDELLTAKAQNAPELLLEVERQVLLRSIDNLWVDHLVAIDHLRTGIGLRGYGQRDPLVEYKKETFRMFNQLTSLIQQDVVYTIYKMGLGIQLAPSVMQKGKLILQGASDNVGGSFSPDGQNASSRPAGQGSVTEVASALKSKNAQGEIIGRNDPCYCGSGKKFKKCHGA